MKNEESPRLHGILHSLFLIFKELPVDVEILHRNVAHILDTVPVLLYIIKVTILQRYVGYMLVIVQPDSLHACHRPAR